MRNDAVTVTTWGDKLSSVRYSAPEHRGTDSTLNALPVGD